jgi:hypothetical protein
MPAAHALSGSFADHDRSVGYEEPPFRLLQGGKAAPKAKALSGRSVRALCPVEALGLAWIGGLVHSLWHPYSEVLIDEGSTPVDLTDEAVSSATYGILARRGLVVASRTEDGETLWALTEAGEEELSRQRTEGHLASVLPLASRRYVELDPEYTAEQSGEYSAADMAEIAGWS